MLTRLSNLTYKERLTRIEMQGIKYCRMRGDMIMIYKVLNRYDPSLEHLFAVYNNSMTRGHNLKLKKPSLKMTIRQYFFKTTFFMMPSTQFPLIVLKISLINVG